MMRTFHAMIRGGRLTLDEPTDLPEGALVELVPVEDAFNGELDEEEQAALNRELALSITDPRIPRATAAARTCRGCRAAS